VAYRFFYVQAWIALFMMVLVGPYVRPDNVMTTRIIFGIAAGFLVIDRYFNRPGPTAYVFLALGFYLGADQSINYQLHVVPIAAVLWGSIILTDEGKTQRRVTYRL
jgi:hypothetical protein